MQYQNPINRKVFDHRTRIAVEAVALLLVLIISGTAHAATTQLPRTGQTLCYDAGGTVIDCAGTGQDGELQMGMPWPDPRFTDNGDQTITDNLTGLVWAKDAGTPTVDSCTGGIMTWQEALDYVKCLNTNKYLGYDDWRLPNSIELASLINAEESSTVSWLNTQGFSNVKVYQYWSSTTSVYGSDARYVDMVKGDVDGLGKSTDFYVWPVRADQVGSSFISLPKTGQTRCYSDSGCVGTGEDGELQMGMVWPMLRFVDSDDGTITDKLTGLAWSKEGDTPSFSVCSGGTKTWQGALDYVKCLNTNNYNSYNDWRLPNVNELKSLMNAGQASSAAWLSSQGFSSVQAACYISSSIHSNHVFLWGVDFSIERVSYHGRENLNYTWPLRGGQIRLSGHLIIFEPAQASRWEIGNQKNITWDTAGIAGDVRITLSRQGGKAGTFTETIAESTPNNGSYEWTVTGPASFNCAMKIEPLSDPAKSTIQSLFTIADLQNAWITVAKKGDTAHWQLVLNAQFSDGVLPIDATWTSSDESIATVSGNILTALQNGYVEVSTTYMGNTYKKGVFVYNTLDAAESEVNNTKAQADTMTGGRFYLGTLPATDTDWFKFTLASNSIVSISYLSQSNTADTTLELFNSSDILMASSTSTNGGTLTLPMGLTAGTYYLKLSIAGDVDQTNSYIVTYKVLDALPAKPAIPVSVGETKTSTLYNLADQTDFTFTLAQEQAIKILFTPPGGNSAKYHIALLNNSMTVVDTIDCLNGIPVRLESIYPAGNYTLRVTPVTDVDAQSTFSVNLDVSTSQLEVETNNSYTQATAFDLTRPIIGRLVDNSDVDFFTFQIDTPRFIELNFNCPGNAKTFYLTLYKESDANEIDGITIQNGAATSLHMGMGIGRYYLKVSSNGDAETVLPYTLTVTDSSQTDLEIESNNTIRVANAIEKSSAKRGRIYSANDSDYFGFYLPQDGFFSISFAPAGSVASYKVNIVNDNDESLGLYTSSGGSEINITNMYQDVPGNYYIKVESNGAIDQSSTYSLTLTSTLALLGVKNLVSIDVLGTDPQMTTGNQQTLAAKGGYSDTTVTDITPVWTSLNTNIATVDEAGVVTAVAEGTTSIVATYGGLTGKFDLTVGAPVGTVKQHHGSLILVAGGGIAEDNTLRESTQYLSDLVYRRFKARLFTGDDIYYLNPNAVHDIDGDGYNDPIVDETSPTVTNFGNAITQWAKDQSTDGPLYVYLIDHGGIDNFMIFPGEIVTADQLKGYLDTFQTQTGRQVIVIIEACKSGSFTDNLITAGQNRIVITSTDDQDAYMQLQGEISFTQFFVDRLQTGDSVKQAFDSTVVTLSNMGLPYSLMQPQLVEGVALSANNIVLGGNFAIASLFPQIAETSSGKTITANTSQDFFAMISGLDGIASVWAVIVPPDYIPPAVGGDLTAPGVALPTIILTDPDKDGRYEGSYSDFPNNGSYQMTFYARNINGNVSMSPAITITVTGGVSPNYQLSISKNGAGSGAVVSNLSGINCGSICQAAFAVGADITLTATAAEGSFFAGWTGGGCSGRGTCVVKMEATTHVTAEFALEPVIPAPPIRGSIGSRITLNGSNFGDVQGGGYVDFNGMHGIIISWSDTQIVVVVPAGARSGCLKIVTDYGESDCTNFILIPKNDINIDGISDILLKNSTTGQTVLWFINADGTVLSDRILFTDLNSMIVGTGDFNNDGIGDLIKRNAATGQTVVWFMNADGTRASYKSLFTDVNSTIIGTGDFNNDGICDLIKRDSVTGQSILWFMNADGTRASYKVLFTDVNSTVAGTGDFNGDGICDLIKRNAVTGQAVVWFMNANGTRASYKIILSMSVWIVAGTGDIDGDGITDIIWRNTSTNQYNLWLMNADGTHEAPITLLKLATWSLAGTGDFNGDGLTDLIWLSTSGLTRIWFMKADGSHEAPVTLLNDPNWLIVP